MKGGGERERGQREGGQGKQRKLFTYEEPLRKRV